VATQQFGKRMRDMGASMELLYRHPARRKGQRASHTGQCMTVQLLDDSQMSGLITGEDHSGVRLYRVERRMADGNPTVEYDSFISVSHVVPWHLTRPATGDSARTLRS
jgi:hypothetical protein